MLIRISAAKLLKKNDIRKRARHFLKNYLIFARFLHRNSFCAFFSCLR